MKIAPLYDELKSRELPVLLLHTGQHYDENMSKIFFDELEMPKPDVYLGVGSGSHSEQTARIMLDFEKVCEEKSPSMVIVAGDVNSTIACALVAASVSEDAMTVDDGISATISRARLGPDRAHTPCVNDSPSSSSNTQYK